MYNDFIDALFRRAVDISPPLLEFHHDILFFLDSAISNSIKFEAMPSPKKVIQLLIRKNTIHVETSNFAHKNQVEHYFAHLNSVPSSKEELEDRIAKAIKKNINNPMDGGIGLLLLHLNFDVSFETFLKTSTDKECLLVSTISSISLPY